MGLRIVKNHKILNNSATTEARENKHTFGILRVLDIFYLFATKIKKQSNFN